MSEINAEIKVKFKSLKSAELFCHLLQSFLERTSKNINPMDIKTDLFNTKELPTKYTPDIQFNQEKSIVLIKINGDVSNGFSYFEKLISYFVKSDCKVIIGWTYDDRVGQIEYYLYHKNEWLKYLSGMKPHIDKKLAKAKESGDLLKSLESFLVRGEFGKTKADIDKAIRDYVKDPSFKTKYVYFDELRTESGSDGETLLTAMIKAGHDEGALDLLGAPNELDPRICNANGELPILLAEQKQLTHLVNKLNEFKHETLDFSSTKPKDLVRREWLEDKEDCRHIETLSKLNLLTKLYELAIDNNLFMHVETSYPNTINLSTQEVIIPGEDQLEISPYFSDSGNKFSVFYYSTYFPNDHYKEFHLSHDDLMKRVMAFINRRLP